MHLSINVYNKSECQTLSTRRVKREIVWLKGQFFFFLVDDEKKGTETKPKHPYLLKHMTNVASDIPIFQYAGTVVMLSLSFASP